MWYKENPYILVEQALHVFSLQDPTGQSMIGVLYRRYTTVIFSTTLNQQGAINQEDLPDRLELDEPLQHRTNAMWTTAVDRIFIDLATLHECRIQERL